MLPGRKYTLDDIRQILWKGRWIMLAPIIPALILGLLVSRSRPELYRASTLIQVLPQRVPDSFVKTTVTSTVEERLKSIEEVVKSRTALEALIVQLDLYPGATQRQMEDLVDDVATKMELKVASQAPGTFRGPGPVNALRVSYTHADKQKALLVTQRITSMMLEENAKMRGSQANATNEFLERQLAETRAKLEEQERKVEAFRQRYAGRLPTQVQSNMQAAQNTQSALASIVESLQRDRDRKYMLERLYNDAQAQPAVIATPAPSGDPNTLPTTASASQRLALARTQLEAMQQRLKPEHPDIRRQKRIIADLQVQADAEAQQGSNGATARVTSPEEARRRETLAQQRAEIDNLGRQITFKEGEERRLRGVIADYQSKIEAVPGVESEWIQLDRDYATINDSYKQLLTKSQEAKIAANLEENQVGEQFKVLDQPQVSDQAANTNRIQINALAGVLGLLLGFAVVALKELRDTSFRTEGDVLTVLSLPVLATLPFVPSPKDLAAAARRRRLSAMSAAAMLAVCAGVFVYLQLWKFVA